MPHDGRDGFTGPGLQADDLIDDRELSTATDDRLAHVDLVNHLAALATTVPTPSNIALYGPWGSGKSGVANLLRNRIARERKTRFVRFDAFKYADVPLRSNFISAVATELGLNDSKFHDDLYSGRVRTEVEVPTTTLARLLVLFLGLLAGLAVILAVMVAAIAFGQSRIGVNTAFADEFKGLSRTVVLGSLLPAALLAALVALASKTFSIDRSTTKPESDEQFESIFRDLVAASKADRLVIFVDELDRCSAGEVVTTLDTIRTFLGVEGCVFVVAADQQVLEEALTRSARQETPADEANPYYSTGAAYLDKVFQYQLSLPPLLTQSVSRYAAVLVEGRGGLWSEINQEYVLSVLVPTHVTSPRRVKHLLNTFALTYRLAQDRYSSGLLTEDPSKSAPAIARMACLRVEFPLFARDLEVDSGLPDLVLALVRDDETEFAAGVSERAIQIARSYALEQASPAAVLLDENDQADKSAEPASAITRAHNRQLLNYLSRTRQIAGPSRDLIFMQSSGTVFGLDGDLALSVEQAAEDVDVRTLVSLVGGLPDDRQEGVLRVLSHQIRTGGGLTGSNAARAFLLLIAERPALPIAGIVDTVIEAICLLDDDADGDFLDEETAPSAWALSKSGSEVSAVALRRRVLSAVTEPDFATPDFFYADAAMAAGAAPEIVEKYLAKRLLSSAGRETVSRLFGLPDDDLITVLVVIQRSVVAGAAAAARAHDEWSEKRETVSSASPAPSAARTVAAAAGAAEEQAEPFDPGPMLSALASAAESRETPVQHQVLALLLAADSAKARAAALGLLGNTESVQDSALGLDVLKATRRRPLAEWVRWLAGVDADGVNAEHADVITSLVAHAWNTQQPLSATRSALEALTPHIAALPTAPSLTVDVVEQFEDFVSSTEEAVSRRATWDRARVFAAAGVVDFDAVMSTVAHSLQDTLAAQIAPVSDEDALYLYVAENGGQAVAQRQADLTDHEVKGLIAEAAASPWLDELGQVSIALDFAQAVDSSRVPLDALPTADVMEDVARDYESSATRAVSLWFRILRPNPRDFIAVWEPLRASRSHSNELVSAAQEVHSSWTDEQRQALLAEYLGDATRDVPDATTLRMLGLGTASEHQVADLLIRRFNDSTNNAQRQMVVALWRKAHLSVDAARRRLVEEIVFPLFDLKITAGNVGAADLALTALGTVGHPLPRGIKTALGQRVKLAVRGTSSLERKAVSVMPGLGYTATKNFLGKKKIDYSD